MHEDGLSWNKKYLHPTHIALLKYISASYYCNMLRHSGVNRHALKKVLVEGSNSTLSMFFYLLFFFFLFFSSRGERGTR